MNLVRIIQIAIGITGVINCSLVALFLFFTGRGNARANRILGYLALAICLKISFALLIAFPHVWGVYSLLVYYTSEAAYFCFGPLLFLYFRALLKISTKNILTIVFFLPTTFPFIGYFFNYDINLSMMQAYFLGFLVIIFLELRMFFRDNQKSSYLTAEKFQIKLMYSSFLLIWLVVDLLMIDFNLYVLELTIIFTTIFYIDFYLIIRHYWFQKGEETLPQKYRNLKLSTAEENMILEGLYRLINEEKIHKDPEITLPKVASRIGTGTHKLSGVINNRLNMTFNEFINSRRVNDIQEAIVLPEYQNLKISSLAYDYGFNTISAFNTAFKKFTSYTPSQYRDEHRIRQNG